MNRTDELNKQLAELIRLGATITIVEGTGNGPGRTVGLAAAKFYSDDINQLTLWYCDLWPENDFSQHWLTYDFLDVQMAAVIVLFKGRQKKLITASIALMEPEERENMNWQRWKDNADETTQQAHLFVSQLAAGI
jgi:hypothetical protein